MDSDSIKKGFEEHQKKTDELADKLHKSIQEIALIDDLSNMSISFAAINMVSMNFIFRTLADAIEKAETPFEKMVLANLIQTHINVTQAQTKAGRKMLAEMLKKG